MMKKVVVVDYGIGNVLSVIRAFEHCGAMVQLSDDTGTILTADYLVLPGVGAFADGMNGLRQRQLIECVQEYCTRERPFLGICLGMQMMMDLSEEFGLFKGLGICRGKVVKMPDTNEQGAAHKIPNIGWYELQEPEGVSWEGTILSSLRGQNPEVYVVHSYMADPDELRDRVAYYNYGGRKITALIAKGFAYGCQFHPEKSGTVGLNIIDRFLTI